MTNVEHQLNVSEARVRKLERLLQQLEAKAGIENASATAEITAIAC